MSSFVSSPVWGAVITITGTAMSGLVVLIARLIAKVNRIEDKVNEVLADVQEQKDSKDIVRWSEIGRDRIRRRRRVI